MNRRAICIVALLSVAPGCSDTIGGAQTVPTVSRILVLGNSITQHGPSADVSWTGNWGMAASSASNDFAHILSGKFSTALLEQRNISSFEGDYRHFDLASLKSSLDLHPDLVVVEVGDNLTDASGFAPAYAALIEYVSASTQLRVLCTSAWWNAETINSAIRAGCSSGKARYVDISGLHSVALNIAASERACAVQAVGDHPGDRGMAQIANVLYSAALVP